MSNGNTTTGSPTGDGTTGTIVEQTEQTTPAEPRQQNDSRAILGRVLLKQFPDQAEAIRKSHGLPEPSLATPKPGSDHDVLRRAAQRVIEQRRERDRLNGNDPDSIIANPDLTPNQKIYRLAQHITTSEIKTARQEMYGRTSLAERFFYGVDTSDETIARVLARDRLFPHGVVTNDRRRIDGVVGPALLGAARSVSRLSPDLPNADVAESVDRALSSGPTAADSNAVWIGELGGEAASTAIGWVVPHLGAPIAVSKAGSSYEQTLDETGSVLAASGTFVIEGLAEFTGYKLIGKIGQQAAGALGRAVMRRSFGSAAKIATGMMTDAAVEVTEEQVTLVSDELFKALATDQDFGAAAERIRQNIAPTTRDSAIVGAMLFIPSLLSPGARRRFRAAMDTRDQAEVRSVLEEEGVDPQVADDVVEAIGPRPENMLDDSEADASASEIDVATEVQQADTADLTAASAEIEQTLVEDAAAEADARMADDARQGLEFVKLTIDAELQRRPAVEDQGAAEATQDQGADDPAGQGDAAQQAVDGVIDTVEQVAGSDAADVVRQVASQMAGDQGRNPNIVRASTSEIGDVNTQPFAEIRRRVFEFAKQNFRGKKFRNEATGVEIEVPLAGIKKATSGPRDANDLVAMQHLPELIEKAGNPAIEAPRQGRDTQVVAVLRYPVEVEIDGQQFDGTIVVKQRPGGEFFYDSYVQNKTDPRSPGSTQSGGDPDLAGAVETEARDVPSGAERPRTPEAASDQNSGPRSPGIGSESQVIPEDAGTRSTAINAPDGASPTSSIGQPAPEVNTQANFGPRSRETNQTKALLERIGLRPPEVGRVTVSEALSASLKRQNFAARIADRKARQEERSKFRKQVRELRAQLIADKKTAVEKARQKGREAVQDVRERAAIEKQSIRHNRNMLAKMIREQLPAEIQGRMTTALAKVETRPQLARATVRLEDILTEHETKLAQKELADLVAGIRLNRIRKPLRDEARAILDSIQPKRLSDDKRRELESRREFVQQNPDKKLPEDQLAELKRLDQKAIPNMSRDEAQAMTERLSSILQQSALHDKLRLGRQNRERSEIARSLARELRSSLEDRKLLSVSGTLPADESPGLVGLAKLPLSVVDNMMPRSLSRLLGGGEGSATHQVLYTNVKRGFDGQLRSYFAEVDALKDFMQVEGIPIDAENVVKWSMALSGQFSIVRKAVRGIRGKDPNSDADIETHTMADGSEVKMTPAERMHILAVLADEQTYDLVINQGAPMTIGRGKGGVSFAVTLQDLNNLRLASTTEQLALVDFIVSRVNGDLKDAYAAWSFDRYGVDRSREGTHFPRKRRKETDTEVSSVADAGFADANVASVGINKERVPDLVNPIQVSDLFASFTNFAWQSTGLVNLDPAIRTAKLALSSGEVQTVLGNGKGGRAVSRRFRQVYERMEQMVMGGADAKFALERNLRRVTRNVGKGILGLNPRVALYQPVSMQLASRVINWQALLRAASEGAMWNTSIDDRMYAADPYLRYRADGSYAGLMNEGGVTGRDLVGLRGGKFREWAMYLIGLMDRVAIRTIWRASEIQARSEGLTGDQALQRTVQLAEKAVTETQPTFDPLHISGFALEAQQRPVAKLFTFFRSQTQKNVDMMLEDWKMVRSRGVGPGLAQLARTTAMLITNVTILEVIAALYDSAVTGEPEEEFDDFGLGVVLPRFLSTPIGGELISFAYKKLARSDEYAFDPSNPLQSALVDAARGGAGVAQRASELSFDERFWREAETLFRGTAILSGLPVQAPMRDARRLIERFSEDDRPAEEPVVR